MIAREENTGLLGICLVSSPLAVAARCPFIRPGVGAISTQAYSHPGLGPLGLNLLELGYTPEKVLDELRANDEWKNYRQIGIVDRSGQSAATTGTENLDWKGHRIGPNYVAMGNYLKGEEVVFAMETAFIESNGNILEERLIRAIEAGRDAGGERGGHLSAGLIVYGSETYPRTDLRVDRFRPRPGESDDAVDELRRVFNEYKPLIPYYEERPTNPLIDDWTDWLAKKI